MEHGDYEKNPSSCIWTAEAYSLRAQSATHSGNLRQPAPPETSSTRSASPRLPRATLMRPNGSQPNYTGGLRFQFQPGSCFLGEVIAGQLASQRAGNFAVHQADRWLSTLPTIGAYRCLSQVSDFAQCTRNDLSAL